jgi:hypothetical protein
MPLMTTTAKRSAPAPALALAVPTAATSLAVGFLGHCLADAVAGLPYDVQRAGALLADDDVYFLAADQLVDPRLRRGVARP